MAQDFLSHREITNIIKLKAPDASDVRDLLSILVKVGGSDLHMSAGSPVMMRVRGVMFQIPSDPLKLQQIENYLEPYLSDFHLSQMEKEMSIDFSFEERGLGIFRTNVFYNRKGMGAVMRLLPSKPVPLEKLGMPSILRRSLDLPNGLILVTGPTGSGKSTTLAAMIDYLNKNKFGHIITLEDPIEYTHESNLCMVNQRALGSHFNSFSDAIRASLREDPDYILVGEMRDLPTMQAAIQAAETGHLVFSTLHTNSAAKTVDRLLNSFPSDNQNEMRVVLSETLRMVVSQKLIASRDGRSLQVFQDILINNSAVGNMIREGKTYQIENVMATSAEEGMQLMDNSIRTAAEEGHIKIADAVEQITDKKIKEEAQNFIEENPDLFKKEDEDSEDSPKPTSLGYSLKEIHNAKGNVEVPEHLKEDEHASRHNLNKESVDALFGLKDIVDQLKKNKQQKTATDINTGQNTGAKIKKAK